MLSHCIFYINHITASERTAWNGKQDKLIAGDNITIAADGMKLIEVIAGVNTPAETVETIKKISCIEL